MQHYQRIRDLREDHDLTQEALCKLLYMHIKRLTQTMNKESILYRLISL